MAIDLVGFVRKWNASVLTERSAAQQHFRDLCEALGVPHPTEADEIGASYTFEKRVRKVGSTDEGFADVWKRGWFAWEYKSKGADLNKAYRQLNEYHEALENPPLLVVCDFVRFEVHTKFENSPSRVYAFTLDDLLKASDTATSALPPLEVLRAVFGDYNQLRPKAVAARVTEAAAADFLRLAQRIELEKAITPQPTREQIAHFLMRLIFCLFADSVELLPNHTFRRLVENDRFSPLSFNRKLPGLFEAMSFEHGSFGVENIPYFNGGLFRDDFTIPLDLADLGILYSATQHDWSHVEPAIFGTLFERSLDAAKRSMIGAHYTSAEDILLIIEPVVVEPLRRRWEAVKEVVLEALGEEEDGGDSARDGWGLEEGKYGGPSTSLGMTASKVGGVTPTSLRDVGHPAPFAVGADDRGLKSAAAPKDKCGGPSTAPLRGSARDDGDIESSASPPVREERVRMGHPKSRAGQGGRQRGLGLNRPALNLLQDWAAELSQVRVLDPACGSGNFLYLALKRLLDLWHEARVFGMEHGLTLALDPIPHPGQLFGIETDFYAHEIASVVVWIGFLQWKRDHGVKETKTPILERLTNIEEGDAVLRYGLGEDDGGVEDGGTNATSGAKAPHSLSASYGTAEAVPLSKTKYGDSSATPQNDNVKSSGARGRAYEPEWPTADFIIGNPPFLGDKKMRGELDTAEHPHYVDDLRKLYEGRVPGGADLVTFWFEKARAQIEKGEAVRAGLLATQGIRGGANRTVLERIASTGGIFMAWSDRPWILEGAAVRVSMVGFDDGGEERRTLDGTSVGKIHPNLTSEAETTSAVALAENAGLSFIGPSPHGRFDIGCDTARKMLTAPTNVNGRPNSDVVRPVANAIDLIRSPRNVWTVDFGVNMPLEDAAKYELPFEFAKVMVYPERKNNNRKLYREKWWLYGEPRPGMRRAIASLDRFVATPRVSKHRIFVWQRPPVLCNDATVVFARNDDYFFGVLHSSAHEIWARAQGTQLREVESGFRYTPDSCFDTFPFPWAPGKEDQGDARVRGIAEAARELVRLREEWLNPAGADEGELKRRTLTKLYNARPEWLANAHRALDERVFAAYGWPSGLTRDEVLGRLLELNRERAGTGMREQVRGSRRMRGTREDSRAVSW